MSKSLSILVFAFVLLFGSRVIAADKVVVIPLVTCGDGLTTCSGECVDTMTNPSFCGGCTPCGANSFCKQGVCIGGAGSTGDTCTAHDECLSGRCLGGTCADDQRKIVFVSSESYTGNLGGLQGADAKCNKLANAADLPGSYIAWLSDSLHSPLTRFNTKADVPYVRVDGKVVQQNWSGLTSGELLSPINLDENSIALIGVLHWVWTNTRIEGIRADGDFFNCDDWLGGYDGIIGDTESTIGSWTYGLLIPCDIPSHIYCVEQ
ncbi:MAG: hypothetical protein KKA76_01820 [Proteobacteria bacterium]|nr:hypothetical protein [Pseudomonadota bacterium]